MSSWLLALPTSSQVPYELFALVYPQSYEYGRYFFLELKWNLTISEVAFLTYTKAVCLYLPPTVF